MIWAMTELVRNPRVMKKVQEEIRATLGNEKKIITEDDLRKVDYLQHVIKETLRLHPPVPLVPRQTMSHVKIQGYDLPPKTSIQVNVWTIGRDPKRWTDPEDFIPERFIDSSVDFRGQNFNLLPFGSGRRICPAIPMSVAGIELALLNFLYFFEWRLPDGVNIGDIDMEEAGTLSVVKKLPLDIFIAGVNTSAYTMIWAMTELIRNPRVMKKVQDEIRTTLGNKKQRITEQDLTKLHYFKLMVKETLRLHPPAPLLLPRETSSHIKIQGYDIPAKTKILINAYAIARDPELWTNSDEFNPDRFLDSSVDYKGLNFELLPFGSGRRICPGMPLGIAIVELGLLNLLYFFDWGLPEKEEADKIIIGNEVALDLFQVFHH
ncbi:unnamed protein product [Thlaspi arvense]|uniref:Cytochrome P450 n=1 Tax=Thlaspi arvense TaxID=13288 RepID=A0AAU9RBU0_THLAR|nr:unnamed protein product [Thlaspi arvense]